MSVCAASTRLRMNMTCSCVIARISIARDRLRLTFLCRLWSSSGCVIRIPSQVILDDCPSDAPPWLVAICHFIGVTADASNQRFIGIGFQAIVRVLHAGRSTLSAQLERRAVPRIPRDHVPDNFRCRTLRHKLIRQFRIEEAVYV